MSSISRSTIPFSVTRAACSCYTLTHSRDCAVTATVAVCVCVWMPCTQTHMRICHAMCSSDLRLEHMSAQHTKFKSLLQRFYLHTVHTTTNTHTRTHRAVEQFLSNNNKSDIYIFIWYPTLEPAHTHTYTQNDAKHKGNGISSRSSYETMNNNNKKLLSLTHAHAKRRRRRQIKSKPKTDWMYTICDMD